MSEEEVKGKRNKPKLQSRRNYSKEFSALQQRVWLAASLLKRAKTSQQPAEWIDAAMEYLEVP